MKILPTLYIIIGLIFCFSNSSKAQSKRYDISISELPEEVRMTLEEYIKILRNTENLDACAKAFIKVAGGRLVNENGESLRNSVKSFSLQKDYNNIKLYTSPIKITRINSNPSHTSSGFGQSAIKGQVYKIWIDKAPDQPGLPAPISIMLPDGHPSISSPKVISIGSL